MKTCTHPTSGSEASLDRELYPIFEAILESPIFHEYVRAFHHATNGRLVLNFVHDQALRTPSAGCAGGMRRFCEAVGDGCKACADCQLARQHLAGASTGGTRKIGCFAGYCESFIPVPLGGRVLAWLRVEPVLEKKPTPEGFLEFAPALEDVGVSREAWEELRDIYLRGNSPGVSEYEGSIELIEAFAGLVGRLACEIASEQIHGEPPAMVAARDFVEANLEDPITLEIVAERARVSPYYLCRLFRKYAGMTMTEYVGRKRVARAKRLLETTGRQVTEIAFEVGFQSLSQFNRSFRKFVGKSPTGYRAAHPRRR